MAHVAPPMSFDTPTITSRNLSRLLSRLDQKLAADATSTSSVEHAKIAANLEYARRLLHTLEADTAAITVAARRQKSLTELGTQKQTIRRLNERLQLAASHAMEANASSGDEDNIANEVRVVDAASDDDDDDYASLMKPKARSGPAVTPTTTMTTTTTTTTTATTTTATTAPRALTQTSATPPAEVRNRFPKLPAADLQQQRADLFGTVATGSGVKKSTSESSGFASTEAQLDAHRSEQECITDDLLQMAKLLKESSVTFGQSLESEKILLQTAQEGLDRNTLGLQATSRNMDTLRKDENVGFLWSMIYLAAIVALVILTLLILFFAPKLRWW